MLDHYQTGAKAHPNLGVQIPASGYNTVLTAQDKVNRITFLKTLTDRTLTTDIKYSGPFK